MFPARDGMRMVNFAYAKSTSTPKTNACSSCVQQPNSGNARGAANCTTCDMAGQKVGRCADAFQTTDGQRATVMAWPERVRRLQGRVTTATPAIDTGLRTGPSSGPREGWASTMLTNSASSIASRSMPFKGNGTGLVQRHPQTRHRRARFRVAIGMAMAIETTQRRRSCMPLHRFGSLSAMGIRCPLPRMAGQFGNLLARRAADVIWKLAADLRIRVGFLFVQWQSGRFERYQVHAGPDMIWPRSEM